MNSGHAPDDLLPGFREFGVVLRIVLYGALAIAAVVIVGMTQCASSSSGELLADMERQAHESDMHRAHVRDRRAAADSVGRMLADSLAVLRASTPAVNALSRRADSAYNAIAIAKDTPRSEATPRTTCSSRAMAIRSYTRRRCL